MPKNKIRQRIVWLTMAAAAINLPLAWFVVPYSGNISGIPYFALLVAATFLVSLFLFTGLLRIVRKSEVQEGDSFRHSFLLLPPSTRKRGKPNRFLYFILLPVFLIVMVLVAAMIGASAYFCFWRNWFPGQYINFLDLASVFFHKKFVSAAVLFLMYFFIVVTEEMLRAAWLSSSDRYGKKWFYSVWLLTLLNFYSPVILVFKFALHALSSFFLRKYKSFWFVFFLRLPELALIALFLYVGVRSGLDKLPEKPRFPYSNVFHGPDLCRFEAPKIYVERKTTGGTVEEGWKPGLPEVKDGEMTDLSCMDLTGFDLSDSLGYLLQCDFNTYTKWPGEKRMPSSFSPDSILRLGMDPGFNLSALHQQGITGKGVGIGMIDNVFFPGHSEYSGNVKWYEEIRSPLGEGDSGPHFHGSATASIALGKNCGVAPEADLYYIGVPEMANQVGYGHCIGLAINRLVDINEKLPENRKIRVISISMGMTYPNTGFNDFMQARNRAEENNIHVVFCDLDIVQKWSFLCGIGRGPCDDPDLLSSYSIGNWYKDKGWIRYAKTKNRLYIPCDSRTLADIHGENAYRFFRNGGQSWQAPWIAGLYALCVQVSPRLTPALFYDAFAKTGDYITVELEGTRYRIGPIANPAKLIDFLKKLNHRY
jgi:hypothetical protein